jgi:hypothetical protein
MESAPPGSLAVPKSRGRGGHRRTLDPKVKELYLAILKSYDRGLEDHFELARKHETTKTSVENALAWRRANNRREKERKSNG